MRAISCFKPQRGKFTPTEAELKNLIKAVSNPNGVNLHARQQRRRGKERESFKPQRGKFTLSTPSAGGFGITRFKPQRGKFTQSSANLTTSLSFRFKPQRGKFTRYCYASNQYLAEFQTPTG